MENYKFHRSQTLIKSLNSKFLVCNADTELMETPTDSLGCGSYKAIWLSGLWIMQLDHMQEDHSSNPPLITETGILSKWCTRPSKLN